MNDDDLAKLGDIAHKAVWRTPIYSTYEMHDDKQREEYLRTNDILIGRSVQLLLNDAGWYLVGAGAIRPRPEA